jgi:hypothetical protein
MKFLKRVRDVLCHLGFHSWKVTGNCHGYGIDEQCRHCATERSETSIGN